MLNKKLMILTIIIVSLLAVSTVNATDNTTDDVVGVEETTATLSVDEADEVVSVEDNPVILEEKDFGNFTELSSLIENTPEGNILELNKDYNFVDGSNEGIQINKAITIDGKGHTLDGNQLSRIFYINANEVVLKDINFINGIATSYGCAIYWDGSYGVLSNCSFINCSASSSTSDSCGSAIYWNGNNGILSNCSFINCSASSWDPYSYSCGGAVYWNGNNGILSNCSFINCSTSSSTSRSSSASYSYGGAVYWKGSKGVLDNCNFVNCSASSSTSGSSSFSYSYGGAVYWESSNGVLGNCSFINCSSSSSLLSYGGAIYWSGDYHVLSNCSFINCSASSSNSESSSDGGAIFWSGDNNVLGNCSFINCSTSSSTSYSYGGAVYWKGSNGILNNCSFINCSTSSSYSYGGAVYWSGDNNVLGNCSFINCSTSSSTSESHGGAVYWKGSNGILNNCSFINCSTSSSTSCGGAVYWNGDTGVLSNCSFIDCSASSSTSDSCGGAVYWKGSNGILNNCSFINCSASGSGLYSYSYGSAVYWESPNGILNNCSFINCSASSSNSGSSSYLYANGGAVYWKGSNGVLGNCSFINCSTSSSTSGSSSFSYSCGGAVYWESSNGVLGNCSFINCSSSSSLLSYGSAIYWSGDYHVLSNCSFVNCSSSSSSSSDGGAVYWKGSNGILNNCSFINCSTSSSTSCGGAVYWDGDNNVLSNCSFINCSTSSSTSYSYGGAVYWKGSNNVLSNCSLVNCSSSSHGSAVYWSGDNGTLINCRFINKTIGNVWGGDYNLMRRNVNLSCSNYTFDYKNPKNMSVVLINVLKDLPINSDILFEFVMGNEIKYYTAKLNNNTAYLFEELSELNAGNWTVNPIFEGDDNYAPCNATSTINVLPLSTTLTIGDVNATVGHEVTLIAYVNSTLTVNEGVVTFFDGETGIGEANVIDGVATLTYTLTTAGEHTITAIYNADNYQSANATAVLSVSKTTVDLSIGYIESVYFTNPSNFAVNVNSNYKPVSEGEIKFYVNDVLVGSSYIYNGEANFNYATNTTGTFILTAVYNETENYLATNTTSYFQVNQMPTTLTGESIIFDEQAYKTFTTELKDNNNNGVNDQPVKIEVIKYSGESATFNGVSDANGITIYDVGNLAGGMWYVTGIYSGDQNYISSSFADKFIVVRMDTTTDIEEIENPQVNQSYKLKANIHDENGNLVKEGIVQFYMDGVDIGSIDLSNNPSLQSALGNDVLGAANPMFEYELGADNDLYINYIPTKAGKHTLTAVYEGTTIYKSSNSTTILDVSNSNTKETTITVADVNTVYNGGKYLVINLNDVNGNALDGVGVTVNFSNGKTLTPTVKNGQAKLSTDGLAPVKTYTATITFNGNANYDKSTATAKVTVKKATPKLTAKAKTFKKSVKTKEYTVTLKTNKNKVMKNTKVTIKVNKITYSAKTNSKGIATFKITKLTKKGTFKSIVTYKGNKYYNKVTKTINIKVK